MHKWYVNMQQSKCSTSYERHNNKLWTTLPIWYMSIQQSTRMDDMRMIQQTNGKIWTMYRDKSESENQNYTTINGRSISIGIFPIWYISIQQSTRMDDTLMIQQSNGMIWTMYRDKSESAKSKLYNNQWAQYFNNDFSQYDIIYNNQPGYHFNSDFCRLWRHPKRDQAN